MIKASHDVDVDMLLTKVRKNTENYTHFVKHAPKMLRQSMMLAYQTAVDQTLKAMDASRTKKPVIHEDKPPVVLLDQNGNAT